MQLPTSIGEEPQSAPAPTLISNPADVHGLFLAHLLNRSSEEAEAAHPNDAQAAGELLAEKMTYLATGSICQSCLTPAPTKSVAFHEQVGMILAFQHQSVKGRLCKKCADRYFTEYTNTTFCLGWWSPLSLVITPFILTYNLIRYIPCLFLKHGPYPKPPDRWISVSIVLAATPLLALIGIPFLLGALERLFNLQ